MGKLPSQRSLYVPVQTELPAVKWLPFHWLWHCQFHPTAASLVRVALDYTDGRFSSAGEDEKTDRFRRFGSAFGEKNAGIRFSYVKVACFLFKKK